MVAVRATDLYFLPKWLRKIFLVFLIVVICVFSMVAVPTAQAFPAALAPFLPAALSVPVAGQALLVLGIVAAGVYVGVNYSDFKGAAVKWSTDISQYWSTLSTTVQNKFISKAAATDFTKTSVVELDSDMQTAVSGYFANNVSITTNSVANYPLPDFAAAGGIYQAPIGSTVTQSYIDSFNAGLFTLSGVQYALIPQKITLQSGSSSGSYIYMFAKLVGTSWIVQSSVPFPLAPTMYNTQAGIRMYSANSLIWPSGGLTKKFNNDGGYYWDYILGTRDFLINSFPTQIGLYLDWMTRTYGISITVPTWVDTETPKIYNPDAVVVPRVTVPGGVVSVGSGATVTVDGVAADIIAANVTGTIEAETTPPGKPGDPGTGNRTPWASLAIVLAFIDLMRAILGYLIRALVFLAELPLIPAKELQNVGLAYVMNLKLTGGDGKYFTNVIAMDIKLIDLIRSMLTLGIAFAVYKAVAGAMNNGLDSLLIYKRGGKD